MSSQQDFSSNAGYIDPSSVGKAILAPLKQRYCNPNIQSGTVTAYLTKSEDGSKTPSERILKVVHFSPQDRIAWKSSGLGESFDLHQKAETHLVAMDKGTKINDRSLSSIAIVLPPKTAQTMRDYWHDDVGMQHPTADLESVFFMSSECAKCSEAGLNSCMLAEGVVVAHTNLDTHQIIDSVVSRIYDAAFSEGSSTNKPAVTVEGLYSHREQMWHTRTNDGPIITRLPPTETDKLLNSTEDAPYKGEITVITHSPCGHDIA